MNQDCKDHPAPQDSRVLLVLLGVTELMAAMVLMAWAALLVVSGLLVAAVTKAHKGLPDPQAPLVRRVPPGYQVRRGNRAHHARPGSTSKR